VRKTVTTRAGPRHNLTFMKKRLFIALIVLALLVLAALGAVIGAGGD
jgi:predicted small secreted protein